MSDNLNTENELFIAIDGGTTNTRLVLARGDELISRVKIPVGAGDTARTGSTELLTKGVSSALEEVLARGGVTRAQIGGVFASGMICSELGLHHVPHIPCPAGERELAAACETVSMPGVDGYSVTFLPGVKCGGGALAETDIMRGEEAEAVGLRALCGFSGAHVLLLPGTHNKIVFVDGDGRITRFFTAMSGELIRCVSEHTILSGALKGGYAESFDAPALLKGYDLCEAIGLTAALFKLRVSSKFFESEPRLLYSMLLGVVLHEDIRLLFGADPVKEVLVAGSEPFKSALAVLLEKRSPFVPCAVPEKLSSDAAVFGALRVGRLAKAQKA